MSSRVRMTYSTAAVLQALDAGREYGFDIAAVTGLRRGTIYPILRRLEEAGMVGSQWEDPDPAHEEGRPARKYYTLTKAGDELTAEAGTRFPAAALTIAAHSES
jgi:PadR family transcriptional regulator PadR